ncbi:hypothetical protein AAI421_18400 [Rhodococcus aetherivorans]|uniref:hypothetical protein n=1 Tax=Rhodococcus aetherivorans TaxID=191292 RepID=UPI0031D0D8D5
MVERESNGFDDRSVPTISQLIAAQMDATGRSFRDLWRASGERVKHQTFQELRSAPPKSWPKNVETIRGMAAALDVTETAIVMAYARSLGVDVVGESVLAQQLPASAAQLTPAQRNAIVQLIRSITNQEGTGHGTGTEEVQEPRTQASSEEHRGEAGGGRSRRSPSMTEAEEDHDSKVTALKPQDQVSRFDDGRPSRDPSTRSATSEHGDDAPPFDPSKVLAAKRGKKSDTQ